MLLRVCTRRFEVSHARSGVQGVLRYREHTRCVGSLLYDERDEYQDLSYTNLERYLR